MCSLQSMVIPLRTYLSLFRDFIPRHTIVAGYYGITLVVRESVRLPLVRTSVFSFPDDNLSNFQWIFTKWIFTKLGVCTDIVEIWFGIANRQSSSIFDRVICPYFQCRMTTLVNVNGFSSNLVCALKW